eukprot:m.26207 g.26207  ORF g.26207 m.26207 type:complete len:321 (+) comp8919_c0_seq1:231-1193(+)
MLPTTCTLSAPSDSRACILPAHSCSKATGMVSERRWRPGQRGVRWVRVAVFVAATLLLFASLGSFGFDWSQKHFLDTHQRAPYMFTFGPRGHAECAHLFLPWSRDDDAPSHTHHACLYKTLFEDSGSCTDISCRVRIAALVSATLALASAVLGTLASVCAVYPRTAPASVRAQHRQRLLDLCSTLAMLIVVVCGAIALILWLVFEPSTPFHDQLGLTTQHSHGPGLFLVAAAILILFPSLLLACPCSFTACQARVRQARLADTHVDRLHVVCCVSNELEEMDNHDHYNHHPHPHHNHHHETESAKHPLLAAHDCEGEMSV